MDCSNKYNGHLTVKMDVLEIKQAYRHVNHNKEISKGKVCPYGSGIKEDKTRSERRKDYDLRMAKERSLKAVGGHYHLPAV